MGDSIPEATSDLGVAQGERERLTPENTYRRILEISTSLVREHPCNYPVSLASQIPYLFLGNIQGHLNLTLENEKGERIESPKEATRLGLEFINRLLFVFLK